MKNEQNNLLSKLSIGQKIKKLRELRNYTQEHMAEQLNITRQGYGKIERDETDVGYQRLEEIAKILQMEVIDLVGFDDKKQVFNVNNSNSPNSYNNIGYVVNTLPDMERRLYEEKVESRDKEIAYLKQIIGLKNLKEREK